MTLKKKILLSFFAVSLVAIAGFAIAISHDSPCTAVPPLTAGATGMRAVTRTCYGGPESLALSTVAKPMPKDGQVLIKVRAASVNPYDWHKMTGKPYIMRLATGVGAPDHVRMGADFAGTIEAIGAGVARFAPGDEVFGTSGGTFAEYIVASEGSVVTKPENITFEEAAAIPIAALTALQGLRDRGKLVAGQKVLINGASGGVGTYAVQIAKALGAEVTGVCSTRNVELVRSLGADHVVDYTREDFTQRAERYHLILDNIGNRALLDLKGILQPNGRVVIVGGPKDDPWIGPLMGPIKGVVISRFGDEQFVSFIADVNEPDLRLLANFAREGKMKSAIDRRFRLDEVPAALAYIGSRRARGKVVVNMD